MSLYEFKWEERFEAASTELLSRCGISLSAERDFDEFLEVSAVARCDHRVADPFDCRKSKLSPENALWIKGCDQEGQVVHLHALRVLPTAGRTVAEYFRESYKEFLPEKDLIDFSRTRYRPGPGARRMAGRVVYSGEFWIGGEPGKFRGTNLSNLLGLYSFNTALRQFAPDYFLGFMARPVAHKGFVTRMGYMHSEPQAMRWCLKNSSEFMEGTMVYMSEEDIRFVLNLPVSEPEEMAA
jgi:hypothetical protein